MSGKKDTIVVSGNVSEFLAHVPDVTQMRWDGPHSFAAQRGDALAMQQILIASKLTKVLICQAFGLSSAEQRWLSSDHSSTETQDDGLQKVLNALHNRRERLVNKAQLVHIPPTQNIPMLLRTSFEGVKQLDLGQRSAQAYLQPLLREKSRPEYRLSWLVQGFVNRYHDDGLRRQDNYENLIISILLHLALQKEGVFKDVSLISNNVNAMLADNKVSRVSETDIAELLKWLSVNSLIYTGKYPWRFNLANWVSALLFATALDFDPEDQSPSDLDPSIVKAKLTKFVPSRGLKMHAAVAKVLSAYAKALEVQRKTINDSGVVHRLPVQQAEQVAGFYPHATQQILKLLGDKDD